MEILELINSYEISLKVFFAIYFPVEQCQYLFLAKVISENNSKIYQGPLDVPIILTFSIALFCVTKLS